MQFFSEIIDMTTSPERPEAVVDRFNEAPTKGYAAVFDEIKKAQTENGNFWKDYGQQINDSVDTSAFTGGRDIQIVGLNSRNELLTTEDGVTIQRRGLKNPSAVLGEFTNTAGGELWGNQGRSFTSNESGQTQYTIKKGDYLDHVVRDILTHRDGTSPSQQDIYKARLEIAKENNIKDPNRIPIGTNLTIPESLLTPKVAGEIPPPVGAVEVPPAGPAATKGLAMDASHPADNGGYYSLFSPPGVADGPKDPFTAEFNDSWLVADKANMQTIPGANGRDVRSYDTNLYGPMWGNWGTANPVSVRDEVNRANGVLEKRTVDYTAVAGHPVDFWVRTPDGGSKELSDVRKVEISRDTYGRYTSIYTLGDGTKYRGVSDPDGSPRYWNHM